MGGGDRLYSPRLLAGLDEGLCRLAGDGEGEVLALSIRPGLCTGDTLRAGDLVLSNNPGLALTAGDLRYKHNNCINWITQSQKDRLLLKIEQSIHITFGKLFY